MKQPAQLAAFLLCAFAFVVWPAPAAQADEPQRFEAADADGVTATRDADTLYLRIDPGVESPISIPRLAAPLRAMHWEGNDSTEGFALSPEQQTWKIGWKDRPQGASTLVLKLDARPLLMSEVMPIQAKADGSFYLPAHLASVTGEKVRYEPQPYKNTLGYWTGKKDSVTWTIRLDKPGRYNVSILQGCGKGQGGSKAVIRFVRPRADADETTIGFEVLETGHFQNFQWRHLGEIKLAEAAVIEVTVQPDQIKKNALMDVRAVHLVRLPD